MANRSKVSDVLGVEHHFTNPVLGEVLTMAEAMALWNLQRRTLEMQIWQGKLETRKAVTGGTILIARASLVSLHDEPKKDLLAGLLMAGKFTRTTKGE
jgi:hypothetical protein